MQFKIKSEKLTAIIDNHGAELHSVKDNNGYEYIWTAKDVWQRHAPVLFPFVCNTVSKKYTVNGKEYSLSNHGFIRDVDFTDIVTAENEVTMTYCSNKDTLSRYPYEFIFSITYTVNSNTVAVRYDIENAGKDIMPFFTGGHPGFICPFEADMGASLEDYDVVYEKPEIIIQKLADRNVTVLNNAATISLSRELFKNDVFLKDKPASSWVCLKSRVSGRSIKVSYDNSGCIAVWSPYDERADFVCLEPWAAAPVYCCDTEELTKMPHAKKLLSGEKYSFKYEITIE